MMSILRISLFFAFMLLAAMPILAQEAVEEPLSRSEVERLDSIMVEINSEFFYEVPVETREKAANILADKQIVDLSNDQVVSLLGKLPDIKSRIEKISIEYSAFAERRAIASKNPILKQFSEKFLSDSKENHEYAEYYQHLKERVRPYLLMGASTGRYNAAFYGIKRGSTLKVIHSYLGSPSTDKPFPVPLIVYLRDKPENVETSTLSVK